MKLQTKCSTLNLINKRFKFLWTFKFDTYTSKFFGLQICFQIHYTKSSIYIHSWAGKKCSITNQNISWANRRQTFNQPYRSQTVNLHCLTKPRQKQLPVAQLPTVKQKQLPQQTSQDSSPLTKISRAIASRMLGISFCPKLSIHDDNGTPNNINSEYLHTNAPQL